TDINYAGQMIPRVSRNLFRAKQLMSTKHRPKFHIELAPYPQEIIRMSTESSKSSHGIKANKERNRVSIVDSLQVERHCPESKLSSNHGSATEQNHRPSGDRISRTSPFDPSR
uniref:Uncharacterized protein n=2 Tax=Aegilops tauschii subsp. strangulata TaxID=200361 RepID=A0A453FN79_AEGTS